MTVLIEIGTFQKKKLFTFCLKSSLAVSVIFVPSYLLIFSLIFSQNSHRCAILCTNNLPVLLSCPLTNPQPVVYLQDLFTSSPYHFLKNQELQLEL